MDTTQAKQIALDWLAANAPTAENYCNPWTNTIASVTVKHPEDPRHSVCVEVRRTHLGKSYDDSEGNTWSKRELKFTANWSAYGSVSIESTAAHLAVMEAALAILEGLKSVLPAEIEEIVETAEDKARRAAKRNDERVKNAALAYVAEHKLTSHLRVGGTKTAPVTLSDTQVTLSSHGKVYSVVVESGLLTVTRVH